MTSLVHCTRVDGSVEIKALPSTGWPSTDPPVAVRQNSGLRGGTGAIGGAIPLVFEGTPVDPTNPPPGYSGIGADIGSGIAPPIHGGTGHHYGGDYMCGWFAEELRRRLAGLGYSTTFTGVRELNPDHHWYSIWARKWIKGHCLVDIHWPNGTISWIEAQYVNGVGVDFYDLDDDGDGKVEYWDGKMSDKASDGTKNISVFNNRAEAEAAGFTIPGN
jgi:hypothetical protein